MDLAEAYRRFPTDVECMLQLETIRWGGTPKCPHCGTNRSTRVPSERRHHCNACNSSFSVTSGTLFRRTRIPLQKWFLAVRLMLDEKRGITIRSLADDLQVNRNTGWYVATRIRQALRSAESRCLLEAIAQANQKE